MSSKGFNFTDSERAHLLSDIRTMLKQTELSGNEAYLYRFSDGPGKSTHAFGLKQSDVGGDPEAQDFLAKIGFKRREIDELSHQGNLPDRDKLNEKLQKHPKEVNDFTDLQIQHSISRLESLINRLDRENPAAAAAIRKDHELQLALVDYDNQLVISDLGKAQPKPNSLLAYLTGHPVQRGRITLQLDPKATLTRNDIQNYIDHTPWGVSYPNETRGRAERLNKALKHNSSEQSRVPRSVPLDPNRHPAGSGTQHSPAGPNRNVGGIPTSAGRAPPTGPGWMDDNAILRSLPAWVDMPPASYPGEMQQPGSGTPTYPSPDPAALLRRNQFFEPMPLNDPFVTGAAGQEGQMDPRLRSLLAPWLGVYR